MTWILYKLPANESRRTELRSVSGSVSHTGGEDEGFFFFFFLFFFWETNVSSYFFFFFFDAQSSANGSERATDNIPIPPQRGRIDNK